MLELNSIKSYSRYFLLRRRKQTLKQSIVVEPVIKLHHLVGSPKITKIGLIALQTIP